MIKIRVIVSPYITFFKILIYKLNFSRPNDAIFDWEYYFRRESGDKKHWSLNDAALVNFMMTFYALAQLKTRDWRRHFTVHNSKQACCYAATLLDSRVSIPFNTDSIDSSEPFLSPICRNSCHITESSVLSTLVNFDTFVSILNLNCQV